MGNLNDASHFGEIVGTIIDDLFGHHIDQALGNPGSGDAGPAYVQWINEHFDPLDVLERITHAADHNNNNNHQQQQDDHHDDHCTWYDQHH